MAGRRRYDQGCAVAHALDLIGERWALLVVRDLLLGPKRFTDLLAGPARGQPRRAHPAAARAHRGRGSASPAAHPARSFLGL